MAGIVDGDGSIFATFKGDSPRFRISVETTDAIIVPHFADLVGHGNVRRSKARNSNAKDSNRWETSNKEKLAELLAGIIPHLTIKKPQAIIALAGIQSNNKALKQECAVSLRILNKKGN